MEHLLIINMFIKYHVLNINERHKQYIPYTRKQNYWISKYGYGLIYFTIYIAF